MPRPSLAVAFAPIASFAALLLLAGQLRAATIESWTPRAVPASAMSAEPAGMEAIDEARRKFSAGQLDDAVAGLSSYVASNPSADAAGVFLGDLYIRSSDRAAAERAYRAVLRHDPSSEVAHDRLGSLFVALGRTQEALEQFALAVPLPRAYEHLVALHRRIGDIGFYEGTFRDAVAVAPLDADSLWALGVIYDVEHRPNDAIPYLKRAVDLTPPHCEVLAMLGDAYLDAGQYAKAADTLQRCLAVEPQNYTALIDLSSAVLNSGGHTADALALIERAQAVEPDRPEAYINLGYVEDQAGRWENAVAEYQKALSEDPLDRDAYFNIAYDYYAHGLYGSAENSLVDGITAVPGDGRLHYVLGLTYQREAKSDLARDEFTAAMKDPSPDIVRAASGALAKI